MFKLQYAELFRCSQRPFKRYNDSTQSLFIQWIEILLQCAEENKLLCQQGVDLFLYLLHRTVDGRNEKMVSSRAILSFFTWLSFIYRVEKIGISEKHLEEMLFSSNSFGRAGGTGQAGNDYLIYV